MNPYRIGPPPKWWGPKLNRMLVRLARPLRKRMRRRDHRLLGIDVRGVEHVRRVLEKECGVLIVPNHPSHADPFVIYGAADRLGTPVHIMATWHVFDSQNWLGQWMLQRHGVFSIDRDGADLQAFRQAVQILQETHYPLVIFAEGEIYHCNDRVTPFRDGPAAIALSAARRGKRPICCVPCALKYQYIDDPTPDLLQVMDQLERQIHWRPCPQKPLPQRIYAFAQAMLSLKEMEFTGQAASGPLPDRIRALSEEILRRIERRHSLEPGGASVPERIKQLRRCALKLLEDVKDTESEQHRALQDDLEDLFFVTQLFSYPGDYVSEQASIERIAETLDKFEEDVLRRPSASIRGSRRVTVSFDEPIEVPSEKRSQPGTAELTDLLEKRVQALLQRHGTQEKGARREVEHSTLDLQPL